jgi:hypothetical protein
VHASLSRLSSPWHTRISSFPTNLISQRSPSPTPRRGQPVGSISRSRPGEVGPEQRRAGGLRPEERHGSAGSSSCISRSDRRAIASGNRWSGGTKTAVGIHVRSSCGGRQEPAGGLRALKGSRWWGRASDGRPAMGDQRLLHRGVPALVPQLVVDRIASTAHSPSDWRSFHLPPEVCPLYPEGRSRLSVNHQPSSVRMMIPSQRH